MATEVPHPISGVAGSLRVPAQSARRRLNRCQSPAASDGHARASHINQNLSSELFLDGPCTQPAPLQKKNRYEKSGTKGEGNSPFPVTAPGAPGEPLLCQPVPTHVHVRIRTCARNARSRGSKQHVPPAIPYYFRHNNTPSWLMKGMPRSTAPSIPDEEQSFRARSFHLWYSTFDSPLRHPCRHSVLGIKHPRHRVMKNRRGRVMFAWPSRPWSEDTNIYFY